MRCGLSTSCGKPNWRQPLLCAGRHCCQNVPTDSFGDLEALKNNAFSSKTIESTGLFFCSSWLLSKHIEKCERKHIEKCERLGTHFCIYNKSSCNGEETPTMVLTSLDRHGAVVPGPVAQAAADCVNQQMLDSRQRVAL